MVFIFHSSTCMFSGSSPFKKSSNRLLLCLCLLSRAVDRASRPASALSPDPLPTGRGEAEPPPCLNTGPVPPRPQTATTPFVAKSAREGTRAALKLTPGQTRSKMLPSVTGSCTRPISILLINPNSTSSMTEACLRSVSSTLPPHVTVHGFTAPASAPTAIEGRADAVLSAADCFRALQPIIRDQSQPRFDAFLVACFSAHPLVPMLREEFTQPCIGIMEASLYASRMCGDRLSVITTGQRSRLLHEDSINTTYGLGNFSVGCEAADVAVLELDSRPREEVYAGLPSQRGEEAGREGGRLYLPGLRRDDGDEGRLPDGRRHGGQGGHGRRRGGCWSALPRGAGERRIGHRQGRIVSQLCGRAGEARAGLGLRDGETCLK